jgi:hypothetical protein
MPTVEIFLVPERSTLPAHGGKLKEGDTIGVTNKVGDYEEVIVLHNPGREEDSYDPDGTLEVYAAPVQEMEGVGRLPAAVHMSDVEVISLVDLDKPYMRTVNDRYGERYTLGAHIGATILEAA